MEKEKFNTVAKFFEKQPVTRYTCGRNVGNVAVNEELVANIQAAHAIFQTTAYATPDVTEVSSVTSDKFKNENLIRSFPSGREAQASWKSSNVNDRLQQERINAR